tara:strand:- start:46 stop:1551 length:1506 start_codon:yes stop_codon:yes gene_type:complete
MRNPKSGSALITTVIFSSILALFAVPTFLTLSHSTLSLANRTHYNVAAINLAESGIEYAVHTLRTASGNAYAWSDWETSEGDAYITLSETGYVGEISGELSIYVVDYQSAAPVVLSKSTIRLTDDTSIAKYMYAKVAASSTSGLFAYGMLVKDFIQASGGVAFDSWISDPDQDSDTPIQFYSSSRARDNVAIATVSDADGAITLGSSDVYGTAAIGSLSYKGLDVGWGGQVGPRDQSEWHSSDTDRLWAKDPPGWKVSTQTGALTTGFTATFEDMTASRSAPMGELTDSRASYELPYTYQKPVSNEWSSWTENVYVDEETLGEPGTSSVLELRELEVKAGATLRIEGDVTIYLPNENVTSLQVIEGGAIELAPDATLTIYTAGDVSVTGAGLFSEVAPQQLQLWGTSSGSQEIEFLNNGQFSGVIYAPQASVRITGNSDLYGSIVCHDITLTGSGSFRYDESLAEYTGHHTTPGPPEVTYVEELTGDERTPYLAKFEAVGL